MHCSKPFACAAGPDGSMDRAVKVLQQERLIVFRAFGIGQSFVCREAVRKNGAIRGKCNPYLALPIHSCTFFFCLSFRQFESTCVVRVANMLGLLCFHLSAILYAIVKFETADAAIVAIVTPFYIFSNLVATYAFEKSL